ncbi:MAG: phage holin [Lachnospiraceae bacterium]|nr:phage holin [Lachnospiraceae bacterium]
MAQSNSTTPVPLVPQTVPQVLHRWCGKSYLLLAQAVATVFGYTFDFGEIGSKLIDVVNALFVVLAIIGVVNDPTTSGISDSRQALTYEAPKKDAV